MGTRRGVSETAVEHAEQGADKAQENERERCALVRAWVVTKAETVDGLDCGDAQRASVLIGRPVCRVHGAQQDIHVSEVGKHLHEYQRLVKAVRQRWRIP